MRTELSKVTNFLATGDCVRTRSYIEFLTNTALRSRVIRLVLTRSRALSYLKTWTQDLQATKTLLFSMIFDKVERRRTGRTSSESLAKRA